MAIKSFVKHSLGTNHARYSHRSVASIIFKLITMSVFSIVHFYEFMSNIIQLIFEHGLRIEYYGKIFSPVVRMMNI